MTMTRSELATHASNIRKPKKIDIREMVARAAATGVALSDYELAQIYAYFVESSAPAVVKSPDDWIRKAIAKNDVRYYLNDLYSDGKRHIGTDGHRLHIHTPQQALAAGWYDVDGVQIEITADYPAVDRVIPTKENNYGQVQYTRDDIKNMTRDQQDMKNVIVEIVPDCWVQLKYVKDAFALAGKDERITVHYNPEQAATSSVLVTYADHPGALAVVMPVRR